MSDWGVGMPACILLDEFGGHIRNVFDATPYLVGSSLEGKRWRDVDVRLILADEAFDAWGFGAPSFQSARRISLELAFSVLAMQMTGLPVDFQIQQRSDANARFPGRRSALIPPSRIQQPDLSIKLGPTEQDKERWARETAENIGKILSAVHFEKKP